VQGLLFNALVELISLDVYQYYTASTFCQAFFKNFFITDDWSSRFYADDCSSPFHQLFKFLLNPRFAKRRERGF